MKPTHDKTYLFISTFFHAIVLGVLAISFNFAGPKIVFENTNKNDVISAVVLGETQKSKILPAERPAAIPTPPPPVKPQPTLAAKPKPVQVAAKKEVIALKPVEKKKPAPTLKAFEPIKPTDLLSDIQKETKKQKVKQKQIATNKFQKILREQAEKTMRQQLFDDNIQLEGTQTRESQGIVNKYQALIKQAISQKWVIPPGVKQTLHAQLTIRLAPGGGVLAVQITRASGDPALDSSARAAVFRASPLPVPTDSKQFEPFREFVLNVTPQDVLN